MYKQFAFCLFAPLFAIVDFEIREYPTIYGWKEYMAFALIALLSFGYYVCMNTAVTEVGNSYGNNIIR